MSRPAAKPTVTMTSYFWSTKPWMFLAMSAETALIADWGAGAPILAAVLRALPGVLVEALVVELAHVGHEPDLQRRRVLLSKRRGAAEHEAGRRDRHGHASHREPAHLLLPL